MGGGGKKNGQSLVQWALNSIAEYNAAIDDVNESILVVEEDASWRPTHSNWNKINVDGAQFSLHRR